jgi:hypothetical protein
MSQQSIWKMLHLLRLYARPDRRGGRTLSETDVERAGVHCVPDTIEPLTFSGAVEAVGLQHYRLSSAARMVLDQCVVASKRWTSKAELQVDVPSVFVIMPFSEPWSNTVWNRMMRPAIRGAGLVAVRGDMPIRVTDLNNTVWDSLLSAGLVIADISVANANVFYELGLAHALGRDVFLMKQHGVRLPADFGGAHYYEYELTRLPRARQELARNLARWARDNRVTAVAALAKSSKSARAHTVGRSRGGNKAAH